MIEAISAVASTMPSTAVLPANTAVAGDFQTWLANNTQQINDTLLDSDKAVQDIALDRDVSIHEAMITMQKAQLTLQFTVEVRNKILESYQEIMRMQL